MSLTPADIAPSPPAPPSYVRVYHRGMSPGRVFAIAIAEFCAGFALAMWIFA